jgi:thiamine biosynthesis lipoprotein
MKKFLSFIFIVVSFSSFAQAEYKKKVSLLGSPFEITVVAKDSIEGNYFTDLAIAEVKRIENQISDWIPTTPISMVNKNAGIQAVKVDSEVYELVARAIKISEITEGAFDISYASMDKIWKFDGSMKTMPTEEAIKKSVAKIGYKNIILNPKDQSIFLKLEGMKLGLGGIGQGYIADKVKDKLVANGCVSGIVNVSGDINAWGKQSNQKSWTVGIVNPINKNKVFATFPLENSSVETSGNYEKYVMFNGISVFAKQTEIADALATGIFVLGVEVGLDLVNQLKGIECIIVDDKGKIHSSKGIDVKKYN